MLVGDGTITPTAAKRVRKNAAEARAAYYAAVRAHFDRMRDTAGLSIGGIMLNAVVACRCC